MHTRILSIDPTAPDSAILAEAAELLKNGELVAFPTETVYGLGAHALDATAVKKIYKVKGRPSRNPLIVHVANVDAAKTLTTHWPKTAEVLAEHCWPGPLTMVLPRGATVPNEVTGGGNTIAIRIPSHPIALALLKLANIPIAAPSANTSGQLSPTDAAHVQKDLEGKIPMIVDGGACPGGIESTVIDLTEAQPRLLRPGLFSLTALEALIGPIERDIPKVSDDAALLSPGMLTQHYAPRTPLIHGNNEDVMRLLKEGNSIGYMQYSNTKVDHEKVKVLAMPHDPSMYSSELYRELHALDDQHLDVIVVELPPETDEWLGVRDRLMRAGAKE